MDQLIGLVSEGVTTHKNLVIICVFLYKSFCVTSQVNINLKNGQLIIIKTKTILMEYHEYLNSSQTTLRMQNGKGSIM